jgi:hypothetical protein
MPSGFVSPEKQCNAKSKSTGHKCKRHASPGSTKCYYHGGASLPGPALPQYKDGSRSYGRYLPPRLKERYESIMRDEKLLEQREEISMLKARITDLVHRTRTGVGEAEVRELRRKLRAVFDPAATSDEKNALLNDMMRMLNEGAEDYRIWHEVERLIKTTARIRESERKRMIEDQQMMSVEEGMRLVEQMAESVKRAVNDMVEESHRNEVLRAVQRDFGKLINAGSTVRAGEPSPN